MGNLINCKDCGAQVSTDAKACPNCGSTKYKPKSHTALKIIGGLFALGLVVNMVASLQSNKTVPDKNKPMAKAEITKSIPSSEHLALAKKYLKEGYEPNKDPMKAKWGNVVDAKQHLEAIKPEDKEYKESREFMKEIARREREIKKVAEKVAAKIMLSQRERYAKQIEKIFLRGGMDVTVSTSGPEKTVLKLDYVLWSRPLIYKFVNENNFLDGPKKTGFKKVIFYDTYNYSWTYKLD